MDGSEIHLAVIWSLTKLLNKLNTDLMRVLYIHEVLFLLVFVITYFSSFIILWDMNITSFMSLHPLIVET